MALENIKLNKLIRILNYNLIFLFYFYFRQTPDDNNITVLSKGNSKGLIASIPIGGH